MVVCRDHSLIIEVYLGQYQYFSLWLYRSYWEAVRYIFSRPKLLISNLPVTLGRRQSKLYSRIDTSRCDCAGRNGGSARNWFILCLGGAVKGHTGEWSRRLVGQDSKYFSNICVISSKAAGDLIEHPGENFPGTNPSNFPVPNTVYERSFHIRNLGRLETPCKLGHSIPWYSWYFELQ